MFRLLLSAVLFACTVNLPAAQTRDVISPSLAADFGFETERAAGPLRGWGGGPAGTLFADNSVKRSGEWSARIERTPESGSTFSTVTRGLTLAVKGERIELRGFLRLENVTSWAGLWLRLDGADAMIAIDNMKERQLKGTRDWSEQAVSLRLDPAGKRVVFGFLLSGPGKVWADDLQLLVDGKPIWEAPRTEVAATVLDRDKEFEAGSKISLTTLSPAQIEHLATLGELWGFLKYHHPAVVAGERQWDYELFRVMPAVLAAADDAAANDVLRRWVESLGAVPAGESAAERPNLHLKPDHGWLEDTARLGPELSGRLRAIAAAPPAAATQQFYVSLAPGVGNPVFEHEPDYRRITIPDSGYQLLALFRFWNIIQYWFPYRNLLDDDWHAVLRKFIPRVALADSADAYKLQLIALIAHVHDSHANLWSSLDVRPPVGDGQLPAVIRFVENRPIVTQTMPGAGEMTAALKRGDVIEAIAGEAIPDLVKAWAPFYAASNEPTRLRDMARMMGRGPIGPVTLRVDRAGQSTEVTAARVPTKDARLPGSMTHDLPGPAFRLLSKDVAYLKLSAVKSEEVSRYLAEAAGTTGWIIDIRNYPSAFVVFELGEHFVTEPTNFVCFTTGSPAQPGSFAFTKTLALKPRAPHYTGRIVVLVDEFTQSSAEYTSMAFRSVPGAIVIGSTTAAADGNVSSIPLPGGVRSMISGIGVFYPDRRPTQRVGIVPDLEVKPTLAGIREGRDELMEAALRVILGKDVAESEVRRLSVPTD